ncbi:sulfate adenylyltransferase subunit CysN [Frateuria sp. MAH-13]|uniref:Multifunctional fusion protein n=1 Tax=Frateuria flava TaxID=2821489 RepID=A0ABS4DL91_9GAMM|nr:sulfate adenylyltransferase subunit CysN [Frateuria flava]MBP1473806.1 sulfate adenylyltransferase subunit CysN [Frateuria flava]
MDLQITDTAPDNAVTAINDYLQRHETKSLLRFITCGSVDDGKSTLLGRLLYDTKLLFDDQLAALEGDSLRHGTQNGELDFALLVDGLSAEREQGITIDVAYRFFSTDKRKFIVADCPGHEQYTRNMATGASTADLAVVLVDARKGLMTQTRRHTYICSLLGIRHVLLAVNKMDLVDYAQSTFKRIESDYRLVAAQMGIENVTAIPLSALAGENVSSRSQVMGWYNGPSLLEHLETVQVERVTSKLGFRMPVQWVCRPNQNFRGYAGQVVAGSIAPGDEIVALPSGVRSRVARLVTADGDLPRAAAGDAVAIQLEDERDISRGDVIASISSPPQVADQFAAHLLWMDAAALLPGRPYWLKIGARMVTAQVTEIKHRVDVNTQEKRAAKRLELNEVGFCNVSLDHAIAFESYEDCRELGAFILIDRQTNATVAAGTLNFALRRADNIHWQHTDVDRVARARIKGQTPACLWFTGLSGSGKSTIANVVEKRLHAMGYHTYMLDGDNVRHGLNRDLGFTDEDRVENIRRVAEVSKLMVDAGLIVMVSFISPFRSERGMARSLFENGEFREVFVDTPLEVCAQRDPKGLYAKAKAGQIRNFTGIDSPYERPENPEMHLDTMGASVDELAQRIIDGLLGQ